MRQLRLPNSSGDVVIMWTPEHDDEIENIISRKMAAGMSFFILEPQAGGLLPPARVKLESAVDARKYRALAIDDPDFSDFIVSGKGQAIQAPPAAGTIKTVRRVKKAREVVEAPAIGMKAKRGG